MKPLAVAMPVHMQTRAVELGDFVIWKDEENYICGGTAVAEQMEHGRECLKVWCREQDQGQGKSWRPSWISGSGQMKVCKTKPSGFEQHTEVIKKSHVSMAGSLDTNHRMTDDTYRRALSLNLI